MQSDFGDPVTGGTSYIVCLYDTSGGVPVLKMGVSVAPGGTCGTKPCWKPADDAGWLYKNKVGNAYGITRVSLKGGAQGKPKLQVSAKGTSLPLPAPFNGTQFFAVDPVVVVQLRSSSPVHCWSSSFATSNTKKNLAIQFKAAAP